MNPILERLNRQSWAVTDELGQTEQFPNWDAANHAYWKAVRREWERTHPDEDTQNTTQAIAALVGERGENKVATMNSMRYAVVIEKGPTSYGAHVPDLPGCAAVGDSEAEVRTLIREAIDAHLEGLKAAGQGVPEPMTVVDYVEAGR